MSQFYSDSEFSAQINKLLGQGYNAVVAYSMVTARESTDAAEYSAWRNETRADERDAEYENQYESEF